MQYWVPIPEMNQNVLTLMAISLPLTSIWATTAVKHSHQAAQPTPDSQRRRLWTGTIGSGGQHHSSAAADTFKKSSNNLFQPSMSDNSTLAATASVSEQIDRMYPDLESGNGSGIHVSRHYSVNSDRV